MLGHSAPEMTLHYATLASPTLHAAHETAMGRMRLRLPRRSMPNLPKECSESVYRP